MKRGEKILIEHIAPHRELTRRVIQLAAKSNISDDAIEQYVRKHFRLALLNERETTKLNRLNRSKMHAKRLSKASIKLIARRGNA
jgi:hypothetical protein